MEKLRIHKTKYRNRGMANKRLKGLNEFHVIFKFETDEKATDFIAKVKEWYYSLEKVGDQIKTAIIGDGGISSKESTKIFDNALDKFKKETDETPETLEVKKPAPAKRKTGRPPKKVVQG